MLENIAMWSGVAGLVVSIFAIIILFLTRQNIVSILNKDAILFDESFHMKKEAISSAFALVDEIDTTSGLIKNNADFIEKAKKEYNDLLCVLSDVRIADEFYNIAVDQTTDFNRARIAQFKLMCRKDIGLKIGKAQTLNRVFEAQRKLEQAQNSQPAQPQSSQPIQPVQAQPIQKPIQPQMQQARPIQPTRPSAPVQQTRPAVQPTQTANRVGRPRKDS